MPTLDKVLAQLNKRARNTLTGFWTQESRCVVNCGRVAGDGLEVKPETKHDDNGAGVRQIPGLRQSG